jgi:hypothetical protein
MGDVVFLEQSWLGEFSEFPFAVTSTIAGFRNETFSAHSALNNWSLENEADLSR